MKKVTWIDSQEFYVLVGAIMNEIKKNGEASDDVLSAKISKKAPHYASSVISSAIKKAKTNVVDKISEEKAKEKKKEEWFKTTILSPILESAKDEQGIEELLSEKPVELANSWTDKIIASHPVITAGIYQAAEVVLRSMVIDKINYRHLDMSDFDIAKDIVGRYIWSGHFNKLRAIVSSELALRKDTLLADRQKAEVEAAKKREAVQAELARIRQEAQSKKNKKKAGRKERIRQILARKRNLVRVSSGDVPAIPLESEREFDLIGTDEFHKISGIDHNRSTLTCFNDRYYWVSKANGGRTKKHEVAVTVVPESKLAEDQSPGEGKTTTPKEKVWVTHNTKIFKVTILPKALWKKEHLDMVETEHLIAQIPANGGLVPIFKVNDRRVIEIGNCKKASPKQKSEAKEALRSSQVILREDSVTVDWKEGL